MARTVIDLDEGALAAAMREYRTSTKVDAVNRALREVAARREAKLRKFSKVMDRMAENLAEVDWDEAYHRHGS